MAENIIMNWNTPEAEDRVNLVFENRFKKYGAYLLRTRYAGNKLIALAVSCFVIVGLFGGIFIYYKMKPPKTVRKKTMQEMVQTVKEIEEKEEDKPEEKKPKEEEVKTDQVNLQPPIIDEKTEEPPKNTELENQASAGNDDISNNVLIDDNNYNIAGDEDQAEIVAADVPVQPDQEAKFNWTGGSFEDYIRENFVYPQRCEDEGIDGKVTIQFALDKKGKILEAYIKPQMTTPTCPEFTEEAIKVLKSTKNLWTPGLVGGKPTTSYRVVNIQLRVSN